MGSPDGSQQGLERGGASAEQLRRHNLSTILQRLHVGGAASRSELAAATGLNRSTIADLVDELVTLGLAVEDRSPRPAGPGRPSPAVSVRPAGAVVLAVELAVDSLAVATVGLGGHVFNMIRIDRPRERFSPAEMVEDVGRLAQPLLGSLPEPHAFAGVGVAVVAVARRSDGFVHLAPNLGWRDIPLGELFEDSLKVLRLTGRLDVLPGGAPVMVANEADLGALGEYRRGAGAGATAMLFVSGEVGVGAGVILGGRPLLGAAGYAGEVGHMLVNPGGLGCRCGASGCWETEAGERALLRLAGEEEDGGRAAVDRVVAAADAGNADALAATSSVGRWMGVGIGDLINIFNPDVVVLGGLFNRLYPLAASSLSVGVESRVLDAPGRMATVVPAALGADAAVIGAAEMALSRVLADPGRRPSRAAAGGVGADQTMPPARSVT